MMHRTVRVRIFPTSEERVVLERISGMCRAVANACIDQRRQRYDRAQRYSLNGDSEKEGGYVGWGLRDQLREIEALRRECREWGCGEVERDVLSAVMHRVHRASYSPPNGLRKHHSRRLLRCRKGGPSLGKGDSVSVVGGGRGGLGYYNPHRIRYYGGGRYFPVMFRQRGVSFDVEGNEVFLYYNQLNSDGVYERRSLRWNVGSVAGYVESRGYEGGRVWGVEVVYEGVKKHWYLCLNVGYPPQVFKPPTPPLIDQKHEQKQRQGQGQGVRGYEGGYEGGGVGYEGGRGYVVIDPGWSEVWTCLDGGGLSVVWDGSPLREVLKAGLRRDAAYAYRLRGYEDECGVCRSRYRGVYDRTRRLKVRAMLQLRGRVKGYVERMVCDLLDRWYPEAHTVLMGDWNPTLTHSDLFKRNGDQTGRGGGREVYFPYGYLRSVLKRKVEGQGRRWRVISEAGTSRTCHRCGVVKEGGLEVGVREFVCEGCGYVGGRNENACLNMLKRHHAEVGSALSTWIETKGDLRRVCVRLDPYTFKAEVSPLSQASSSSSFSSVSSDSGQ